MKELFSKRKVSIVAAAKLEKILRTFCTALQNTFWPLFSLRGRRFELLYNVVIVGPSSGTRASNVSHEIEVSVRLFRVRRKWFAKHLKKKAFAYSRERLAGIFRLGYLSEGTTTEVWKNAYDSIVNRYS